MQSHTTHNFQINWHTYGNSQIGQALAFNLYFFLACNLQIPKLQARKFQAHENLRVASRVAERLKT